MVSDDKGTYHEISPKKQSGSGMTTPGILGKFFDREFRAEFLSTLILVLLGNGSVAQYKFLNKGTTAGGPPEPFLSINFGYACAVTFGAYLAAGVSGAHMNPAVSLALAVIKKFKWGKVPKYIVAQMLGGFFGALLLFVVYIDRLMESGALLDEESYSGIFSTFPNGETSTGGQLLDQVVGTFLLMLIVCALIDNNNSAPPSGVTPILVGGTVFSIGLSFGTNCGYAINPARDFAPRLATAILGYDKVFERGDYYFWIPIVGPIIGAILGAVTYMFLIEETSTKLLSCAADEAEPTDIVTSNGASDNDEVEMAKTAA